MLNVFASEMSRLGAPRRLAAAVSGGADSTALALLAAAWGADVLALIVDHGLREPSAAEAALTAQRLAARNIPSRILALQLPPGPGLQARARMARYAALSAAAVAAGRLHVLLGHHAADQEETVAMRAARGPGGAEGMAAWSARDSIVLLRPLLTISPAALRAYLTTEGMAWVEDPSNTSEKFERVRIRAAGAGISPASSAARQARELEAAAYLARHATIRPEGFAILHAPSAPPAALGALIRIVGGSDYPPAQSALTLLAANLRPATIGGVRIAAAARLGGWLLAREPAYVAPPIPAEGQAIWDRRFMLEISAPPGHTIGALGPDAQNFRKINNLPALILRAMPALRAPDGAITFPAPANFRPPAPATFHPFFT